MRSAGLGDIDRTLRLRGQGGAREELRFGDVVGTEVGFQEAVPALGNTFGGHVCGLAVHACCAGWNRRILMCGPGELYRSKGDLL